jgi:hypothetical protein
MANHDFHTRSLGLEPAPVRLHALVTIGATGAPTLTRGKGIKSISRTSAGLYVLTLAQPYMTLLGFTVHQKVASGLPAAPVMAVSAEAVATASAPTITFQMSSGGVATDPDNGATLLVAITLSNSTAL